MTGTLHLNRIAPFVLLALAVAAGAATLRVTTVMAPAFPLIDRPAQPEPRVDSAPAQVLGPDSGVPAIAPGTDTTPRLGPQSPANVQPNEDSSPATPMSGSSSNPSAPTTVSPVRPSRFADGEPTIGPLRAAPAQLSPKQPRPAGSN